MRRLWAMTAAGVAVLAQGAWHGAAFAADPPLAGTVSAPGEAAMEGVVVSAKKAGSTITVAVVSDAQGHFSFPTGRLEPGRYSIKVRATGFDLPGLPTVEVADGKTAAIDLKLRKTTSLPHQLSNAEWIDSVSGSDQQKRALLGCIGCHTLERPLESTHTAEEFVPVLQRMATYAQVSNPIRPQRRLDPGAAGPPERYQKLAEWLATVNLSKGENWDYPLKIAPRVTGRGTHVVVTEYDLPRATVEPHDVVVDAQGEVWYSDFGELYLGRVDPKSGRVTEYPISLLKQGAPEGSLDLEPDPQGNFWLGMMYQASIAKFDVKAEKFELFAMPPEINNVKTQINMVMPAHAHVDGKVWTNDNGIGGLHRLDLATGKFETFEPFKGLPKGYNLYDVVSDSGNNAYFTNFSGNEIGRMDAKTGKVALYNTPTPHSQPRRGRVDAQDRFWFAEYGGNRVAMFDPKTEQVTEFEAPTKWFAPYDAVLDKEGSVWTAGMTADRALRINTKTGESVEYPLPRETNGRRVFVDNSTTPPTFWLGNNHGSSIIKVEPID